MVKILIAFDNSEASKKALAFALKMKPIANVALSAAIGPTYDGEPFPEHYSLPDSERFEIMKL